MIARLHFIYTLAPDRDEVVATDRRGHRPLRRDHRDRQADIKRVLAYSTISQIGYMMLGVGVGAFSAGIFHLMTHAFFKGLLFLCSGSVIHGLQGEQDMNKMGALEGKLPITYADDAYRDARDQRDTAVLRLFLQDLSSKAPMLAVISGSGSSE